MKNNTALNWLSANFKRVHAVLISQIQYDLVLGHMNVSTVKLLEIEVRSDAALCQCISVTNVFVLTLVLK